MGRIYFEVETPLKRRIRTTKEYWEFIITFKHPNMRGREKEVIETLKGPDFIRISSGGAERMEMSICITAKVVLPQKWR